jgi:hypothetical protein
VPVARERAKAAPRHYSARTVDNVELGIVTAEAVAHLLEPADQPEPEQEQVIEPQLFILGGR